MKILNRILVTVLLISSFQKVFAAPVCCATAAQCSQVITQSANTAQYGVGAAAIVDLASKVWELGKYSGEALNVKEKDFAGSYAFNLQTMVVLNKWEATPALGLKKAGSSELEITQICWDEHGLQMGLDPGPFIPVQTLNFEIKKATRITGSKSVEGYRASNKKGEFFFSPR